MRNSPLFRSKSTEIDAELKEAYPDYAALSIPTPLAVRDVQSQLGSDQALVLFLDTPEWQPTQEETFVWVVTKTGMRWLRSDLGKGTTFYFDIIVEPIAPLAGEAVVADRLAGPHLMGGSSGFQGASVLLAEDNPVTQEVIREYLQRLGIDVCVAEDGRRAVALGTQRQFDAILMDCQMPDMDGFEATRLIRTQAAESGREAAPITALTANAFVEDRARCLKAGMTDYLSKPFTAASLRQKLSKHLKRAAIPPMS